MANDPVPGISRRRFIASTGVVATAAWLAPRRLFAATGGVVDSMRGSAADADITVKSLRGNVSALIGSGGNIAVLTGKDGKLLIDAGLAGSEPKIVAALSGISPDPVKHLVNTHWHFDHTDGNQWLHAAGASIAAHENTVKHLSTSTRVDDWDFTFPPSPAGAIPTTVIEAEKTIDINGTKVALKYYGPAHTDGDLSAHFTDADVFHTGDTWWNGHFPFIDYSTGGSIDGTIRAAEANLALAADSTLVIPGHGPIGDKQALREFHEMLTTVREKVSALKRQGKTADEVVATKPTAAYDAKWGTFVIAGDFFTRLVYKGV
ncbi:MAG TPA: MBL fold metallo-hydrolase [Lacipirellulaceae bacterium]|jgi:glyoxylase-like metal-dependent hydrolase (beta-lactamase superfamily II)